MYENNTHIHILNSFFCKTARKMQLNKARTFIVKAFEKAEKLMVKLVVEQLR